MNVKEVRIGSTPGLLRLVPHLLGFPPVDSLVVLGVGPVDIDGAGKGGRLAVSMRVDLDQASEDFAWTAETARRALRSHGVASVWIAGYGPVTVTTNLVLFLRDRLGKLGERFHIIDAVRVTGDLWYSYVCEDPDCCSPEGNPVPGEDGEIDRQLDGLLPVAESRAQLVRVFDPPSGEQAEVIAGWVATARAAVESGPDQLTATRLALREVIRVYRDGKTAEPSRLAFLAAGMWQMPARDEAWSAMGTQARQHLKMWTDVLRYATGRNVPPVAGLASYTAWQCGDGMLARAAAERALTEDPGYPLALVMLEVIESAMPPRAYGPVSPEEVPGLYEMPDLPGLTLED